MKKLNIFKKLILTSLPLTAMAGVEVEICDLNTKYQYQWNDSSVLIYAADHSLGIKDGRILSVNDIAQALSDENQKQVQKLDSQIRTGLDYMIKIQRISLEMRLHGEVISRLSKEEYSNVDANAISELTESTLLQLDEYFVDAEGQFDSVEIGEYSDSLEQNYIYEFPILLDGKGDGTMNGQAYQRIISERQHALGNSNKDITDRLRENVKALDRTEQVLTESIPALEPFDLAIIRRIEL